MWRQGGKVYVPSPLAAGNRLFVVQDNGVARCLDAGSGEEIWSKRLGGSFSASPVLAAGAVFAMNEAGVMHIFKAADHYEELGQNDLGGDGGFASPVICAGRLYLRTEHFLYCIGQKAAE